jgi:hypothetical protein
MGWYRFQTGWPQEPKLAVIARSTGRPRGEVMALWVALHDHAANANPRGSVHDIEAEELAALLEADLPAVKAVLKAFRQRGMILEDGMLHGWEKQQKLSTARTRAFRSRMKVQESDDERRARLLKELRRNS